MGLLGAIFTPERVIRQGPKAALVIVPLIVLSFFVLRGCDSADVPSIELPEGYEPPTTVAADPAATVVPTTAFNPASIVLAPVGGTTTTTEPGTTGAGTVKGTVVGATSAFPGMVVRLERFIADQVQVVDVDVNGIGQFSLDGLPGGHYRARAFQVPSLAQVEPTYFFLADGGEQNINLVVERFDDVAVVGSVAPNPPYAQEQLNLVVQVSRQVVGSDGYVRSDGAAGLEVNVVNPGSWALVTNTTQITDDAGRAAFVMECRSVTGPNQVQVTVRQPLPAGPRVATLELPGCAPPPVVTQPPPTEQPTSTTIG